MKDEPGLIDWMVNLANGGADTITAHRLRVSELGVLTAIRLLPDRRRTEVSVKLWAHGAWISAEPILLLTEKAA